MVVNLLKHERLNRREGLRLHERDLDRNVDNGLREQRHLRCRNSEAEGRVSRLLRYSVAGAAALCCALCFIALVALPTAGAPRVQEL